jgi:hypothetical protein
MRRWSVPLLCQTLQIAEPWWINQHYFSSSNINRQSVLPQIFYLLNPRGTRYPSCALRFSPAVVYARHIIYILSTHLLIPSSSLSSKFVLAYALGYTSTARLLYRRHMQSTIATMNPAGSGSDEKSATVAREVDSERSGVEVIQLGFNFLLSCGDNCLPFCPRSLAQKTLQRNTGDT